MRLLYYSIPLGGVDSDIALHSLLDKITQVELDNVPAFNSSRSFTKRRPSFSPGRRYSAAGDFVWFNAWKSSFCSPSEAQLSRQHGRQISIPDTLPDPRAESVCSRPSVPSSPRLPITASVPRAQSPAPSPTGSSMPAVPSIRLRSQPVPSRFASFLLFSHNFPPLLFLFFCVPSLRSHPFFLQAGLLPS